MENIQTVDDIMMCSATLNANDRILQIAITTNNAESGVNHLGTSNRSVDNRFPLGTNTVQTHTWQPSRHHIRISFSSGSKQTGHLGNQTELTD